jgi:hypothetical protein
MQLSFASVISVSVFNYVLVPNFNPVFINLETSNQSILLSNCLTQKFNYGSKKICNYNFKYHWLIFRFPQVCFAFALMFLYLWKIDERPIPSNREYYYCVDIDNLSNLQWCLRDEFFTQLYWQPMFVNV